ncbi:MAG: hypothetical protein GY884_17750 [Proteobacteria bacterium]|nr:hypothetical protein [Pseudomonadota bacterium]
MFLLVTTALATTALADTGAPDSAAGFAADTGVGCDGDRLITVAPDLGATDVPLDLVPTAFFSDCEGSSVTHTASVDVDGASELVDSALDGGADGEFSWASVPVELVADASYQLTLRGPDGQDTVVAWETGSGSATLLSAGPVLDELEWQESVPWIQVTAETSAHGPTFLEARDNRGDVVATGVNEVGRATLRGSEFAPVADPFCATLFQRDVDGSWIEGDTFCEDLPRSCGGCTSTGASPGWLALGLGALLLRRRR